MTDAARPIGRFIAVVGPSGVGKDSLMARLVTLRPGLHRARRVITRPIEAGGEVFDGVSEADFLSRAARGDFALHWSAHGLHYGIPLAVQEHLDQGRDVLANLSRSVLMEAGEVFGEVHVLNVGARPEILAQRLSARGRESAAGVAKRLARPAPDLPPHLTVSRIDNSGVLDDAVAQALAALYPDSP